MIAMLWWRLSTSTATKTELTAVKTNRDANIAGMKADLKDDIVDIKADMKAGFLADIAKVKSGMTDLKAYMKAICLYPLFPELLSTEHSQCS